MLISICIPTYNNAAFIGKTLRSVIDQTYAPIEIVVVDNASTDNTEDVVRAFKDDRIRYCRNDRNIGAANNFNKCIRMAKEEIMALYHSDDIYDKTIVEKEARLLMSDAEAGAVFALDTVIDENDVISGAGVRIPGKLETNDLYDFDQIYLSLLEESANFLVCPTFMARKEVFEKVGMFCDTEKYGDWIGGAIDTVLWLKIAEKYRIGIVKERLIYRRELQSSGTGQYVNSYTTRSNHLLVLDHFLDSPAIKNKPGEKLLEQYDFNKFWDDVIISKNLVRQNRNREALNCLKRSLTIRRIKTGCRTKGNLGKMAVYMVLYTGSLMGVSKYLLDVTRKVKRYIRREKRLQQ